MHEMRLIYACVALQALLFAAGMPRTAKAGDEESLAEIVVSGPRRARSSLEFSGNIEQISSATIEWTGHHHIGELLDRVAGAWIVRGSGQDHQTALRSPVLGGPGSCGGFLILEDGVPIRPAGFCNTNQLVEVYAEQAASIEVIRGPGKAWFGSNALHGIINVLMPVPGGEAPAGAGVEYGANDFRRAWSTMPFATDASWLASINVADDGGFRDRTGSRQGKLHLKRALVLDGDPLTLSATITELQQESAGFIVGYEAYRDEGLSRTNPSPQAFREVTSARVNAAWDTTVHGLDVDVRPYVRRSSMRFLHHSVPGQPVERNGQTGAGVLVAATAVIGPSQVVFGLDVDGSSVFLEQTQTGPAQGSPVQQETRPEGRHYDYEVDALIVASFVQGDFALDDRWFLSGGLRIEHARYDYDNRMISGNTRDDGTPCGFGGCVYSRPDDRKDNFASIAPNLAVRYRLAENTAIYLNLASGFRTPQTLELYRLQNGQDIADLDPEYVRSAELGIRRVGRGIAADVVAWYMHKRDSTFRDAEGFNVSGARTRHHGIETDFDLWLGREWLFSVNASYAIHKYDFDVSGRGEEFISGNDVKSAPRWLGGIGVRYLPDAGLQAGLRVQHVGEYFLDPRNERRYGGHTLVNLRAALPVGERFTMALKLNNLLDTRFADRADFAARDYRYLPGRGREMFMEIRYSP